MCCFMLSLSGIVHAASIEIKPCIKRLRKVKKHKKTIKPSAPKSGHGRLQEMVVYERFDCILLQIGLNTIGFRSQMQNLE